MSRHAFIVHRFAFQFFPLPFRLAADGGVAADARGGACEQEEEDDDGDDGRDDGVGVEGAARIDPVRALRHD